MSKNYKAIAEQILPLVGGKENVRNCYHCQTRLRFTLADEGKADKARLESLDAVRKVMINAGVYQVVIGTDVADLFAALEPMLDLKPGKGNDEPAQKKGIVNTVIDFIAGTFQPIIPALSGAGMLRALMAILVAFHLVDTTSQTYAILNFFGDAVFYFLPILLAFSQAQKLRCNPVLAAAVAGIMMHPTWNTMVAAGEPVSFFNILPFTLVSYTGTVIPIILVTFAQSYVEKILNKYIPKSVNLVFVPMLTFLIMGLLALSILGPIGNIVGQGLSVFFNFLSTNASWAPALLIGGLLPVMVMFGLHNSVAPLGVMQMADLGYDSIFGPGCVCSNIAQGVAALVVAVRTKNIKDRQISVSGGITALMGITEPVLYGVNLPKKYPLVAAMIGGGCGGLYAGLTHTHRFATGSSGLPAVFLYIGDDTMTFFYNIIIALIITAIVTAIVTFVLSFRFEKTEISTPAVPAAPSKSGTVCAPVSGQMVAMAEIPDETFATGVLGQGVGIIPTDGRVAAPFSGTISTVADSQHAVGITSPDGMEVLIHIGVDTVDMNGKGFHAKVKEGDAVAAGQELISFDRKAIQDAGHPDIVVVLLTNADDFDRLDIAPAGAVKAGAEIIRVPQTVPAK